jgi:hypothetical protein
MSDRLRIVSHFPGRLRVRSKTFRMLPEIADDVAQRLREEGGVSNVEIVRRTGSLLVHYEPRVVELPRLVELLVRAGGLHGLEMDASDDHVEHPRPGAILRETLDRLDDEMRAAAGGKADLRTAIPGTLAAAGLAKLMFGHRRIPEWYDMMFWAFVTFVNLNPPEPGTSSTR